MLELPEMQVGHLAMAAILAGASMEEVISAVKIIRPESRISKKCVYYYRKQLRKAGLLS